MRIRVLVTLTIAARIAAAQSPTLSCEALVTPSDSGSGRFGDVAEGRDGRRAWTDGRPGQFLLRDARGKVRVVGRRGAGPGEFNRPANMVWRADTLFVSDWRLRRVQAFSDTGRLLRVMTAVVPGTWAALPDDRLVAIRPVQLTDESGLPDVLVSQRPEDLSIDTIARFASPAVARFERVVGGVPVRNHQPFHALAFTTGTRDGSRFCGLSPAERNTSVLRCTNAAGTEVLNRRLTFGERPLTTAIYDSVIAIHLVGGSTTTDLRSKIDRPRSLPPVMDMIVNQGGEVWLQRSHRFEPNAVWARVRPDGTLRDEVTIPSRYRFIRPDGEIIWAATADADGLETLHRCRIG